MRRRPAPHLRVRGSAVVEMMLTVPFLVMFTLAMLDFSRGHLGHQRARRAARHVAWCAGRDQEDPVHPDAPDGATARTIHFLDKGGEVTVSSAEESLNNPVSSAVETVFDFLDLGGSLGRGVVPFLAGTVEVTRGTAAQEVTGVRLFPGTSVEASHWVSLRCRREENPSDPIGWFDPIQQVMEEIEDLF
jgi:hypothetical protein